MKKCYIVVYDVSDDGDYDELYKSLKSYSGWAKITESSWAIVTEKKASDLRNELEKFIGSTGRIFIVKSGVEAAWRRAKASNEWFKKNL
ncbi:hypothetical protein [Flavobacterium sp.]|uniref:hypothetical protein n=1 Tax=Flavobacterium sp. TaxID=239 RepID=UPI0039E4EE3E